MKCTGYWSAWPTPRGFPKSDGALRERPGRIEALFELTGGNPRALGLIFKLLQQGPNSRAVEDFERLMDVSTPYYKARFEDLSEQAQVVMHTLAVRGQAFGEGGGLRFGHTAAEIGTHAGLPTNTVSAQLDILEREGLVEKSAARDTRPHRRTVVPSLAANAQYPSHPPERSRAHQSSRSDVRSRRTTIHLQVKQGASGFDETAAAYRKAIELAPDDLRPRNNLHLLQTRLDVAAVRQALNAGNSPALLIALGRFLADSGNVAAALVSDTFVEGFQPRRCWRTVAKRRSCWMRCAISATETRPDRCCWPLKLSRMISRRSWPNLSRKSEPLQCACSGACAADHASRDAGVLELRSEPAP